MSGSASFSVPSAFSDVRSVLLLIFSIIATLAVVLRFWARRIQKIRLELNDYMIVLGLIFALAEAILYIYFIHLSLAIETTNDNLSTSESTAEEWNDLQKCLQMLYFISQIFWAIAVALIRSSIILLYIRIFPARSFRFTCYAVLTLNAAFSIGAFLTDCLICSPIVCSSNFSGRVIFDSLNAIISLLLDVTVVVLPMPLLWGLQMAVSKKAMLSGVFGLGTAICAVTAYRFHQTKTTESFFGYDNDLFGSTTPQIMFLMCLEAILGVLNACLPVLKPIFNKVRGSVKRFGSEMKSLKYHSIPISVLVSQMWGSRTGKHTGRGYLDSMIPMEAWRNQNVIRSTSKADRVVGMKVFEINVQKDVYVETASGEDQTSVVE